MALDYRVHSTPTETWVAPSGEIDLLVADELVQVLMDALSGSGGRVVVDLSDVTLLDSSGIRALLSAHKTASDDQRTLVVENCTPIVRRVLDITGVLDLLRSTEDRTPTT